MKFEPLPYKTADYSIDGFLLLLWADNRVQWKNEDKYDRRWQARCGSCLSPCCFVSMNGYWYDYGDETNGDPKQHEFFSNDFVIMNLRGKSLTEHAEEDGFNVQLDAPELNKLQICPLNIDGKCSIYADRPKICRAWKCNMKLDRDWGTK